MLSETQYHHSLAPVQDCVTVSDQ